MLVGVGVTVKEQLVIRLRVHRKCRPVQTLSAVALVPVAVLDLPDTQSVHELAPALLYLPATQSKTITENNNNNQINHKYYSIILSNTKLTRISLCTFFMDLNVNTFVVFCCYISSGLECEYVVVI